MNQIVPYQEVRRVASNQLQFLSYEKMPLYVQGALRPSLWISLITNVVFIVFYLLFPPSNFGYFGGNDFFVWRGTIGWINWVFSVYQSIAPSFLVIHIISLLFCLITLLCSRGFTIPIREYFHWGIGINAIPAGLSIICGVAGLGIVLTVFIINLVTWILGITFAVIVVGAILSSIGR